MSFTFYHEVHVKCPRCSEGLVFEIPTLDEERPKSHGNKVPMSLAERIQDKKPKMWCEHCGAEVRLRTDAVTIWQVWAEEEEA